MAKPMKTRYPARKSSSSTLVLTFLLTFSFVVLIVLALWILSMPSSSSNAPKAHDLTSIVRKTSDGTGDDGGRGEQWVEVISWEPRAFVYHNFLSKKECEYLIELAAPRMKKSAVVDSATGKSKDSRVRTSSGTLLARGRDKIIRDIEKRIAEFTFIPWDHTKMGDGLLFWSMKLEATLDESSLRGGCSVIKGN